MDLKQHQPLHFYGSNYETAKATIGNNRQINPLNLIPQKILPKNNTDNENANKFQGTFLNDHLRLEQGVTKGKRISKPDKRTNHKTSMCPHGRQCRRQMSCNFAHSSRELRKPFIKRTAPCLMYQMGQCQLGAACRNYHGNMDLKKKNYKYKANICEDFLKGHCLKGVVCIYIHQLPTSMQQEEPNLQEIKNNEIQVLQPSQNQPKTYQEHVQRQNMKNQCKKQAIEVVEQLIGKQEIVEDGFSFSFNFNP